MRKAKSHEHEVTRHVVGPGECEFITGGSSYVASFGLHSCIVIAVYVPRIELASLLRFSFPDSAANPDWAERSPRLFADRALPEFFARIRGFGAQNHEISVYAVGGALSSECRQPWVSGKSNYLAARKFLWREGILVTGEDTGGHCSRSLRLEAATGRIIVRADAGSPQMAIRHGGADLWRSAS